MLPLVRNCANPWLLSQLLGSIIALPIGRMVFHCADITYTSRTFTLGTEVGCHNLSEGSFPSSPDQSESHSSKIELISRFSSSPERR
jgi:hypothetical protein